MKHFLKMAIAVESLAVLALMALPAQAQSQSPAPAQSPALVTDPLAAVPAVVYQSVFKESPVGVETQTVDWKKANAEVAQFPRGHVDILKWEEAQSKAKAMEKPMQKPLPPAVALPPSVHKH